MITSPSLGVGSVKKEALTPYRKRDEKNPNYWQRKVITGVILGLKKTYFIIIGSWVIKSFKEEQQ